MPSRAEIARSRQAPVSVTRAETMFWRKYPATEYVRVHVEGASDSHLWMTLGLNDSGRVWIHLAWDNTWPPLGPEPRGRAPPFHLHSGSC